MNLLFSLHPVKSVSSFAFRVLRKDFEPFPIYSKLETRNLKLSFRIAIPSPRREARKN